MSATLTFDAPMPGGRPSKLTLAQRMAVCRRLRRVQHGLRGPMLESLAADFGVSLRTIERALYGA